MKFLTSILGREQNLLRTALGHFGYKRFLEDDLIANLEALQSQGRLESGLVSEARNAFAGDRLKPKVSSIEDIVSGSTLRGRGAMYRVDWNVNGTNISSFVNIYDSRTRAQTALHGQSYFHNLLDLASKSFEAGQLPKTKVLMPRGYKSAKLVSNMFIDAHTLNEIVRSENSEELLLGLATDFKRLFDLSYAHEQSAISAMNGKGIKLTKEQFADADYTKDFLEKFIYRVNPSVRNTDDPWLDNLVKHFDAGISEYFKAKPRAISHRDPIMTNVLREKDANQYLIDFECTARDTIDSWMTPLLFKANSHVLESKILAIAGMTRQDALLAKSRDNLLWVGRLIEFANMPNVENKTELVDAANYRFTLAIDALNAAKLTDLSDSLQIYFKGRLKVLEGTEMNEIAATSSPASRLVSIVNTNPKYDSLKSLRAAFAFMRTLQTTAYVVGALGILGGYYLLLDRVSKHQAESTRVEMQKADRYEFAETFYKSRQRSAFDFARDYCLDNPDKSHRFSIYSPDVKQVAVTNNLDPNLVLNILKANRVAAGIDMMKSQYRLDTVNVFDVFAVNEGFVIHDPLENFTKGAKRLSDLVTEHNENITNAVAAFYNPIMQGGQYLGNSISGPEEVESIAANVRIMTWNALNGVYEGNMDFALSMPPDNFKINMDVDLGKYQGSYTVEVVGDRTSGVSNVKLKVLATKTNNSRPEFFAQSKVKLFGAK